MKKTVVLVFLCLSVGLGTARAQLKVDFTQTGDPVQAGFQGYFADHEVAATFTAENFAAFGTTVTILPTWAAGATRQAMQMIDRGGNDGEDTPDLMRDWIGTDGRQPGDPMVLTISGLPAGTYLWLSYHHDMDNQTGVFDVTVNDATGSTTTTGIDISDLDLEGVVNLADATTFATTIVSDGSDITLVFDLTSSTSTTSTSFFVMNGFELTDQATQPVPGHQETDVFRDGTILSWMPNEAATAHDVYLGTDYDDVDDATTASDVYTGRQDANRLDPGRLELGTTYYWRVDEVFSDSRISKGDVWSFAVEPVSIRLAGEWITATASSSNSIDEGPEKTVDGSGLDADDLHSAELADMWIGSPADSNDTWIQYEFDRVYPLHQMLVWNHNSTPEPLVGFGIKGALVEYSLDGLTWSAVETQEFAQARGKPDYAANTAVEFNGAAARYVRITARSNWGGLIRQYGLSEVRFMVIPAFAREPEPQTGAAHVAPQLTLRWRAGRETAAHDVYLGSDADDLALVDTVDEPSLNVDGLLEFDRTYYWRVDEVNDFGDPAVWEGEAWSFSTRAVLIVDDFESYTDDFEAGEAIWQSWIDGLEDPAKGGSVVGNAEAPFAEQDIVHVGTQSMNLFYDSTGGSTFSEATRTFDGPQDWTGYGIKGLTLWFHGDPGNTAAQMYVKVNGRKVTYDGDADVILRKPWQFWYIDLGDFTGADLATVNELTVGFEGGAGVVYVDDIALSPKDRQLVTPVEPDGANLVAHYALDGSADDSAGAHPGTINGEPEFIAGQVGQAMRLDGVRDYVLIEGSFNLPVYSAATWFKVEGGTGARDLVSLHNSAGQHGLLLEVTAAGTLRFLHRAPLGGAGGTDIRTDDTFDDGGWYHAAIVKSADATMAYVNGELVDSVANDAEFGQPLQKITLGVLRFDSLSRYLPGALDEVYLYSRPLSQDEVAWLAGRTTPYDRP